MGVKIGIDVINRAATARRLGAGGLLGLVVLSALAVDAGMWKLLGVSWVAFLAMAGAAPLGARAAEGGHARGLVWGYGLASGAMVTSAAAFLLPQAFELHPTFGGFGVAAGVLAGFGTHTLGHRLTHATPALDHTAVELSAHALSAGAIIGVVYGNLPDLGPLLGLAIVSHKGPAGYAAARRLTAAGRDAAVLLLPAAGVGLTAIPAGLVALPEAPAANAAVFGFAAGIFLHVALDFLPKCELGGEVYAVATATGEDHHLLDRLRLHAVASTSVGALAVAAAWLAVA